MNAPRSPHPSAQTLGSFGLGKLDDELSEAVGRHLEECDDCRNRVAELSADNFLKKVRRAEKPVDVTNTGASLGDWSQTGAGLNPQQQGPPAADTLPPGFADNPDYEILRELGRGGMGVVYLAHNKLLGRDEVLKVMGRRIMERPGGLDRFLREIRAVAKFRHPNIVSAYSATRIGESLVFSMEYVDGLDLARLVKAKGPLSVNHACHFIHQAALGLQHAHEEGLVHRDMKPANLMLAKKNGKPIVKVLDFGLAKLTREEKIDGGLTSEGQALGTPDFIAPEQIRAAQSADIRADIYSLGGTLYYLLAGRPPFKATSLYDMYQAHISRDADPLNLIRPEVPSELAALVAKMLAKEPAERFQTPGEVAEALSPFFKKSPPPVPSPVFDTSEISSPKPARPLMEKTISLPIPTKPAGKAEHTAGSQPLESEVDWKRIVATREDEEEQVEAIPSFESAGRPPRVGRALAIGGLTFGLILGIVITIKIRTDSKKSETTIELSAHPTPEKVGEDHQLKTAAGTENALSASLKTKNATLASEPSIARREPIDFDRLPGTFTSLFNGKNLDGWRVNPDTPVHVKDGVIETHSNGRTYTEYDRYRDFHLRAEIKAEPNCVGGLFLRTGMDSRLESCYVVRISTIDPRFSGDDRIGNVSIYHHETGQIKHLFINEENRISPGEWFTIEAIAIGSRFVVRLNNKEIADVIDPEHTYAFGRIALQRQIHFPGNFQCRKIEIKQFGENKDDQPVINSIGMKLVPIPAGEFEMGLTPEAYQGLQWMLADHKPAKKWYDYVMGTAREHHVKFTKPWLMGSTEVTVGQFKKFVEAAKYQTEAEKYGFGESDRTELDSRVPDWGKGASWRQPKYVVTDQWPVSQVTWNDAVEFCNWLSKKENLKGCYRNDPKAGWTYVLDGNGYRLPTEAEWEYACQAGQKWKPNANDVEEWKKEEARHREKEGDAPGPVAGKAPNRYGLYDMRGSLIEWCQDWFSDDLSLRAALSNPLGPFSGDTRVQRGGGWGAPTFEYVPEYRSYTPPSSRASYRGFRVVRVKMHDPA